MTTSLEQQAAAVEISAANLRGHVDNLADLVSRRRRSEIEYRVAADRLPALEAAAKTLRWMVENESSIRRAINAA